MSVRTGNTPDPRRELERLHPGHFSGGDIPGNSRYVQYQAELGSSDPNQTPSLERRLDRLLDGGGHDGANDHAEDAGA